MKKILILTASAGEGHNGVARGLKKGFEEKGAEVKIVDLYKECCCSKSKRWIVNKGYKIACRYARPLYNACYGAVLNKKGSKTNAKTLENLKKVIEDYKPDVIIAPHVYVATTLANYKRKYGLNAISVFIVTDYSLYPYVADTVNLDYIVLPHESMVSEFLELGFNEAKLLPLGIPVDPKFSVYKDKSEARMDLGLDDKFTILVMTGGGGFGSIEKLLKQSLKADGDYQIICINGNDKNSFKRIEKFITKNNLGNVLNLGFINGVVSYMNASDCMVGKCGAINLTESLNAWVPLICRNKLVYQELCNYEFLNDYGAIIGFRKFRELPVILTDVVKGDARLNEVKKNILKVRKLNASNDLIDKILTL